MKDWDSYGSHSCHSGGATFARQQGLSVELIKRHGKWKSDGVFLYLRDTVQSKLRLSMELCL